LVLVVLAEEISAAVVVVAVVCFSRRVSRLPLDHTKSQLHLRRIWGVLERRRQSAACILPRAVPLFPASDSAGTMAELLVFQHRRQIALLIMAALE
jgi:hypothetical protein